MGMWSPWRSGLVPPKRVDRLSPVPDRHQVPPAVARRYREILRGTAAPVRDLQRLRGPPAVRAEILGPEPHRSQLPATGPAGQRGPTTAVGVEPGGRGHAVPTSGARRT